ncbi:MAG: hypothetical protein FWH03_06170 [Firmicutes bacterium]|nr:hypothetical protein [Bacillota bacterium]
MTEFKTVALPQVVAKLNIKDMLTGKITHDTAKKVLTPISVVIEGEARGGWKFHSFNEIEVLGKPGCIGSLFGAKPRKAPFVLLVFEKES